jgi:hypothetical protein
LVAGVSRQRYRTDHRFTRSAVSARFSAAGAAVSCPFICLNMATSLL